MRPRAPVRPFIRPEGAALPRTAAPYTGRECDPHSILTKNPQVTAVSRCDT